MNAQDCTESSEAHGMRSRIHLAVDKSCPPQLIIPPWWPIGLIVGDVPPQSCRRRTRLRLLIVVMATFQRLYVFVLLDIGTRRIVHWNLTEHPTAEWTIQQFRNGLPLAGTYRVLVHDRDGIFAPAVDEALR